ncbi:MAG: radical SAM protein [Clostridia bacterium]|nr:radical SAM protein [Clostridia bacterium]
MVSDFTIGRSDFSVTVYVPWDCTNRCKFCSSKEDYKKRRCDFSKIKESLMLIRDSILPIVVFTGGEPSANPKMLRELLSIVDDKIVYINTSLPKKNSDEFIDIVNRYDCIKSISISRHKTTYEEDLELLHDIVQDEVIATIKKPVRINVVSQNEETFSIENVKKYVERWERIATLKGGMDTLVLNMRSDYVRQDRSKLHEMTECTLINELAQTYFYESHTFCNVCDTCTFSKIGENKEKVFRMQYHRGIMNTAVYFGNIAELNDLIIFQNGDICYDWDGTSDNISKFLNMIKKQS